MNDLLSLLLFWGGSLLALFASNYVYRAFAIPKSTRRYHTILAVCGFAIIVGAIAVSEGLLKGAMLGIPGGLLLFAFARLVALYNWLGGQGAARLRKHLMSRHPHLREDLERDGPFGPEIVEIRKKK
jgi:hypothetical protein